MKTYLPINPSEIAIIWSFILSCGVIDWLILIYVFQDLNCKYKSFRALNYSVRYE
jgi:hypothetical protein